MRSETQKYHFPSDSDLANGWKNQVWKDLPVRLFLKHFPSEEICVLTRGGAKDQVLTKINTVLTSPKHHTPILSCQTMHTFPNSCGGNLNHYKCSPANVSSPPPSLIWATSVGWKDKYGLPSISSASQCCWNVFQSNPHEEMIRVELGSTIEIHTQQQWSKKH